MAVNKPRLGRSGTRDTRVAIVLHTRVVIVSHPSCQRINPLADPRPSGDEEEQHAVQPVVLASFGMLDRSGIWLIDGREGVGRGVVVVACWAEYGRDKAVERVKES